ncbi:hypothetical protein ACQKQD_18930 [Methylobacterium sp. NPDC080182]|uniref:hypothetical protein n=1 Tax=Methylobacterium sp. NPDC080182 TaxID=3390590 RepID=UPI003CFF46BF
MAEVVAPDLYEPEDEPGFDLDDAAIIACIALIIAGSLRVVGIAIRIAVGG